MRRVIWFAWLFACTPGSSPNRVDTPPLTTDSGAESPVCTAQCGCTTDRYLIPPGPPIDVLVVVDNSGSMYEDQVTLGRHFDRLMSAALLRRSDWHLAVTSTGLTPYVGGWTDCPGGADGGEAGRFFPVDGSRPRILTSDVPDVRATFAANVKVGNCHWYEEGLEAMRRALSSPLADVADDPTTPAPNDGNAGFLREEAALHVLFVSDEDDATDRGVVSGPPVADYVAFLESLKSRRELVTVSAVVGTPEAACASIPSFGTRYIEFANAFGGTVSDICGDWGADLERIGSELLRESIVLWFSKSPAPDSIRVFIDGVEVPAVAGNGGVQWTFDPAAGNAGGVVFEPTYLVPADATVSVTYEDDCTTG